MRRDALKREEVERLDLAARALVTESALSGKTVLSFIFTLISVCRAAVSTASHVENVAVWAIPVFSVAATLTLLARWRYALHLWGIGFWAVALGIPFFHLHSRSMVDWISAFAYCLIFAMWGWDQWKRGVPFARTRGKGWQKERSQVREWFVTLEGTTPVGHVVEVNSGSFWTGYFTYRLLNEGNYWAVAKFKKSNPYWPVDYRVRDVSAVQITELVEGKRIELEGRLIGHCVGCGVTVLRLTRKENLTESHIR